MVIATFLPTNGSIVEHQSYRLGNTLVMELHPSFSEIPFLIALKFDPTLADNWICANKQQNC